MLFCTWRRLYYVVHTHLGLLCSYLVCSCAPDLRLDWAEEDQREGNVINVPPEVYKQGCVHDVDEGIAVSIVTNQQY